MHHPIRTLAVVALLAATTRPAVAHVDYFDIGAGLFLDPNGLSFDDGLFNSYGWFEGTKTTLGDSHDLAGGRFYRFTLASAARVTITFTDLNGEGALNPALSLYAGLLPDEAHDSASFDPLNPSHFVPGPPPHSVKDPSPVDDGVTTDANGNVSPFRDTVNITFTGQFDALGDWSMANASNDWAVIRYLTHVGPNGSNSVSLVEYLLAAGDYTIAAGGGWDSEVLSVSDLPGRLTFSAAPVPLPGMGMLFGGAVVAMLGRRRRAD